ncbi:D-arabinitol 4-dehydrogenase [Trinickia caryophylli]|uniref:D-arabinitol 4-dehydrogenase n=1 Tax=Trinickia caryophylli TaxID=28094 RepID=A0A1X7H2P6_TRICW|nr:D-arabinitol 4-dehydrogenase [Trinickia caryophylli]PMS10040.1 mannitol dehydrogenase family protein [Trinickia caryophylli]TRX18397.1 mannitol dehydrogenase family protein [Trinickia caryophylli]WQE10820.1 D-arabinitol 4-dehydrogenase [Trinickia caryophylli]SMF78577.1 D-arabinitol 4-dehydrogenase [Trinickia caryophylli]GLU35459.1 D-arabinitol 4-dehydrogenase [Trinickia caryophylli]
MDKPASSAANVILHLGAGSFHRAHQAWYLHRLNEAAPAGEPKWSLTVGNIRGDMNAVLDALAGQKGVYTLETVTPQGVRTYETIRSIERVVPWSAGLEGLVEAGADPACKIVSFTVTEGGYYLDEHDRLDTSNPDIAADLSGARTTIYGALAAILDARRTRGAGPVTLQSCDNLRSNGERFEAGMRAFLEARGLEALSAWFEQNTTCPNSMVDRITPRPTPDVRERVKAATGVDDACPVMGESFIQWVIEDRFAAGRPAWERAGAELVDSVLPYEEAKIRILNASHSCIAWAGTLVGLSYIHEGTGDADIRAFAHAYVTEDVIPSLTPSPLDLARYRDVVLERFGNPYIQDTNQRVAADGFSKIPGFIAPTLAECFARGVEPNATAVLPALFFRFLDRWQQGVLPYAYQDGLLDEPATRAFFTAADPLAAFSASRLLWGGMASKPELVAVLRSALARVDAWLASRH